MSTSSGVSDSEDSSREQYEPIHRLAMIRIQPPRNPNKPFTSFSIRDILGPAGPRSVQTCTVNGSKIVRPWDSGLNQDTDQSSGDEDEEINVDDDDDDPPVSVVKSIVSPLDALMAMASKTFQGLETPETADAKRREQAALFGKHQPPKKRRKSRTAFTNQQIYELEKRFLYQKYLTPADRDEIAQSLGLTNAQVITWFQNRRAKLKRDLEELKNDVTAAKKLTIGGKVNPTVTEIEYLKSQAAALSKAQAQAAQRSSTLIVSSPEQSPINSPSKSSDDHETMDEDHPEEVQSEQTT